MEGVFITRSKFVNVDYGIILTNSDRMPEGMISENHINAHVVGLSLKGKKFVTIRDNLFYHQTSQGQPDLQRYSAREYRKNPYDREYIPFSERREPLSRSILKTAATTRSQATCSISQAPAF